MGHLQRVWHASRERLPFRTPGSVPHCGTCLCSYCWDQIPQTCHVFTRLFTSNTPWYFLDFALLLTGRKQLASRFNFTYRYIDDVLSTNNREFENYSGLMYPVELEIEYMTESNTSASYLDLLLSIGRDNELHTPTYDKRDDFDFYITNFPLLHTNIPASPAYGVFISQFIQYDRACSSYECFILRATRLSNKLLEQGYVKERLKSSLKKFYSRYGDLINQYEVPLSRMLNDIL